MAQKIRTIALYALAVLAFDIIIALAIWSLCSMSLGV